MPPEQPDETPSGAVRSWARRILVLVVAGFVGATLYRLARDFHPHELELKWWPLLLLTVVLVLANFCQAFAWANLLERFAHRRMDLRPTCAIYCAGQLARYTPGKVALLVVRVAGAKRLGLDARQVASSVGIEVLSWMSVGMLLGTLALATSGQSLRGMGALLSHYSIPVAVLIVFGMLALLTVDRNRFPRVVLRAIRADGNGPLLSLSVLGWQALSWLGCVAQAWLLPIAVGASFGDGWSSTGLFILAPIAGFLAMVAPGGLGVREAVLSFALAPTIGPTRALAVALLARGAYLVSELIAWFVAKYLDRTIVT